jgi:hypothetical protein
MNYKKIIEIFIKISEIEIVFNEVKYYLKILN